MICLIGSSLCEGVLTAWGADTLIQILTSQKKATA